MTATAVVATIAVALLVVDLSAPMTRPPVRLPGASRPEVGRRIGPTTITVEPAVAVAAGLCVATLSAVTLLSPASGFATALVSVVALLHSRRVHRRRLHAERQAAVPELIDALVALIRSGLTPQLAWRELPACSPAVLQHVVTPVIAAMDGGLSFADALGRTLDDLGPSSRGLFDALVTAERYGSPLVPALDRLSIDAAAERRRLADSRARQLPVRLALPLVVCTLPSFVLLGIVPVLVATISSLSRP